MKKSFFLPINMLVILLSVVFLSVGCSSNASPAPEISAKFWLNTQGITLEENRDKIIVVEFWATWCPPCRAVIPHIKEMTEKYKDKNVIFVSISNEPRGTVESFAKKAGMTWPVAAESNSAQDYQVSGIPASFIIIDKEIRWNGHPAAIDEVLETLVAEHELSDSHNTD